MAAAVEVCATWRCARASRELGDEADVALDEAGFGFRRHAAQAELECETGPSIHAGALGHAGVFSVLDDAEAHARGGGEGFAHDAVFEDGLAVVGDGDGAGGFEGGEVVEGFAFGSARGGGDGKDAHAMRHAREPASSG